MSAADELNSDQRADPRSRIYLAAALLLNGIKCRVTVRDLARGGARIQMKDRLPVGSTVELERGQLNVKAKVVWRTANMAGLRFEQPVAVDEWLLEGSDGQRRVDRVLERARAGAPLPTQEEVPDHATLVNRLIEEIGFAERLFEAVGEALAEIPEVVAGSAMQLQSIEIGCKILRNAADLLKSEDKAAAVHRIGLHDMKARLLRR